MMKKRVTVAKRVTDTQESFGKAGQPKYDILGTFWMAEDFNRGVKSLREGAMDAYDTVMFRCRFNKDIDRWCLLKYHGKWYQIQSFNESYQDNTIQITAIEMANQKVTILPPILVEIWKDMDCTQRPSGRTSMVYAQFKKDIDESVSLTNSNFTLTITIEDDTTSVVFSSFESTEETNLIQKGTILALNFRQPSPVAPKPMMDPTKNYTFRD